MQEFRANGLFQRGAVFLSRLAADEGEAVEGHCMMFWSGALTTANRIKRRNQRIGTQTQRLWLRRSPLRRARSSSRVGVENFGGHADHHATQDRSVKNHVSVFENAARSTKKYLCLLRSSYFVLPTSPVTATWLRGQNKNGYYTNASNWCNCHFS